MPYLDRGVVGPLPSVVLPQRSEQEVRRDMLSYLMMLAVAFRGDTQTKKMIFRMAYNLELLGTDHGRTYPLRTRV